MKTTHTPGPWTFDQMSGKVNKRLGLGYIVNGPLPDNPTKYELEPRIADCYGEDAQRNARAISALPDLIEACEAFIADPDGCDPLAMAKAAIAKARGEG